jgi:hypothetical protein
MTDIKLQEIFDALTELETLEFKIPVVCPVTACVPRQRDGHYLFCIVSLNVNCRMIKNWLRSVMTINLSIGTSGVQPSAGCTATSVRKWSLLKIIN